MRKTVDPLEAHTSRWWASSKSINFDCKRKAIYMKGMVSKGERQRVK